jgi:hypothetical protein
MFLLPWSATGLLIINHKSHVLAVEFNGHWNAARVPSAQTNGDGAGIDLITSMFKTSMFESLLLHSEPVISGTIYHIHALHFYRHWIVVLISQHMLKKLRAICQAVAKDLSN